MGGTECSEILTCVWELSYRVKAAPPIIIERELELNTPLTLKATPSCIVIERELEHPPHLKRRPLPHRRPVQLHEGSGRDLVHTAGSRGGVDLDLHIRVTHVSPGGTERTQYGPADGHSLW